MYCRSCGSPVEDGKAFCANCGSPVQITQPQPAVQPQPVMQPQPVILQPATAIPAPVKRSRAAAIAGFILGIPTLYLSWILYINVISIITGLAGIILSIIGITKKNGALKPMAVIGLILNFIGFTFACLVWAAMFSPEVNSLIGPILDYLY